MHRIKISRVEQAAEAKIEASSKIVYKWQPPVAVLRSTGWWNNNNSSSNKGSNLPSLYAIFADTSHLCKHEHSEWLQEKPRYSCLPTERSGLLQDGVEIMAIMATCALQHFQPPLLSRSHPKNQSPSDEFIVRFVLRLVLDYAWHTDSILLDAFYTLRKSSPF